MGAKSLLKSVDSACVEHQVLDCTLRDGGYYNNWDFSPELIQRYLDSIATTGVRIAELGFRSRHHAGLGQTDIRGGDQPIG